MKQAIDVKKLAEEIFHETEAKFIQDAEKVSDVLKEAIEKGEDAYLTILAEYSKALRTHSERFTVALVQKVVDELQKD